MPTLLLRCAMAVLALLLAVAALCGERDRAHAEGVRLMLSLALPLALGAVCFPLLMRLYAAPGGKLLLLLPAALCVIFALLLVLELYARRRIARGEEAFLLVPGTVLDGERPGKLLEGRLAAALVFLRQNEAARAVVSGGRVGGETCSESAAMRRWLEERGLDPKRLAGEDGSRSTYENFLLSRPILREMGWREGDALAVATDRFHFWRAARMARAAGFRDVRLIPAKTGFFRASNWYFRELLAIGKLLLCGTEAMNPKNEE